MNIENYIADFMVEGNILLEIKASEVLVKENEVQLTNYLEANELEVRLLLNFGKKPQIKRKVFSNQNHHHKNHDNQRPQSFESCRPEGPLSP